LIENCSLFRNVALDFGGAILATQSASPILVNVTMIGNAASLGGGIYCNNNSTPSIQNSIIAFCEMGEAIYCDDGSSPTLECCDLFNNESGDWIGCVVDQYEVNGNISLDPLFCDPDMSDFTLRNDSPCAPDNNDCGVLMGAWPVGCSTSISSRTWSEVKALY
jgi:predicted outer membrane repeat protein